MNPTTRVSASLAGAVLVGALVAAGYGPLDATLGQLREACLADAGGGVPGAGPAQSPSATSATVDSRTPSTSSSASTSGSA